VENEEALIVYFMTRTQTTYAGSISIPAIESAMRMLGISDQRTCLGKVLKLSIELAGVKGT
jgi:hypothetical protein